MQLADEYRPNGWDEVAGQDNAVASIQRVLARGVGGRAFWLTGLSGSGKTTMALLIAGEVSSDLAREECEAGALTPAKLRDLERTYACKPLPMDGKVGWAIICNEAHRLRRDTVAALLDVLERLPSYVTWCFTTTKQGKASLFEDDKSGDCAPLVSRCTEIVLEDGQKTNEALAVRAKLVSERAGLDVYPDWVYRCGIDDCQGNLRALLQRIESGQLVKTVKAFLRAQLARPVSEVPSAKRQEIQKMLASLDSK